MLLFASKKLGFKYMDAVDAFARTGDRPALFRGLLAVGVSGAAARWHLENVGRCFCSGAVEGASPEAAQAHPELSCTTF